MYEAIIDELIQNLKIIEDFDKDSAQDGQVLHQYLIHLTNIMARANFIMADFNRRFREEKKIAYLKLTVEYREKKYFAVSLAKDYVDAQCANTGYVYDLAERLSRLCVHTQEAVRTIVSSLKSERIFSNYQT